MWGRVHLRTRDTDTHPLAKEKTGMYLDRQKFNVAAARSRILTMTFSDTIFTERRGLVDEPLVVR